MKKSLSILSLTLGLLMSLSTFVACSSDDDNGSSNPLVGTWWIRYIEKAVYHQYEEITFNADYTCSWAEYNEDKGMKLSSSGTGTYKVDGNKLTMWWADNDYEPETVIFSIKDNHLIFPPDGFTDGIWTRK